MTPLLAIATAAVLTAAPPVFEDVPSESKPAPEWLTRGGLGLGFTLAPSPAGPLVWAVSADLSLTYAPFDWFELRPLVMAFFAREPSTDVIGVLGGVQALFWFRFLGGGLSALAGPTNFLGGQGEWAGSVMLLVFPLRFRLGERVRHEVGVDAGALINPYFDPIPLARIVYTVTFGISTRPRS